MTQFCSPQGNLEGVEDMPSAHSDHSTRGCRRPAAPLQTTPQSPPTARHTAPSDFRDEPRCRRLNSTLVSKAAQIDASKGKRPLNVLPTVDPHKNPLASMCSPN